jgi:hypothetical protein
MNSLKKPKKIFSLQEANQALVLVKPIVKDILTCINKISVHKESYFEKEQQEEVYEEIQNLQFRLIHHLNELKGVGVILVDLYFGVVDFPMIKDGNEAFFSWKFGEEEICFYHEKNADHTERIYLYNLTKH